MARTTSETVLMVIGGVAVICLAIVLFTIFNGWVLAKMWLWLVVPTFGWKAITIPEGMGIYLVIAYLTRQDLSELEKKKDQTTADRIGNMITPLVANLFVLLIAFIIKHWI